MTNVLKMMMVEAIQSLRSAGLSCREIARLLGIHRETVSRYLKQGPEPISKPASAPIFPAATTPLLGFQTCPTLAADVMARGQKRQRGVPFAGTLMENAAHEPLIRREMLDREQHHTPSPPLGSGA